MKKAIILLALLVVTNVVAQERSTVTVKSSEVNNGVVILTIQQVDPVPPGRASFVLQCNKGMSDCVVPPLGNYFMVRLPKNWGMYMCSNVDLYPLSAEPQTSEKVGEYCLIEK